MWHMGDKRDANKFLGKRPEEKRPLARSKVSEDNIKMDLQEVGWASMDWIELAQDTDRWQALANVVMNPWFP